MNQWISKTTQHWYQLRSCAQFIEIMRYAHIQAWMPQYAPYYALPPNGHGPPLLMPQSSQSAPYDLDHSHPLSATAAPFSSAIWGAESSQRDLEPVKQGTGWLPMVTPAYKPWSGCKWKLLMIGSVMGDDQSWFDGIASRLSKCASRYVIGIPQHRVVNGDEISKEWNVLVVWDLGALFRTVSRQSWCA